jgi:DNA polymerase III sliding clamp (beta) subunit (PCNA family)
LENLTVLFFPKHTVQIADLCGDNQTRYSLQGIHVLEYEGGHYRVEASDGHYAGIVKGQSVDPAASHLTAVTNKLHEASNGCYDYIVPRDSWNAGFKLCKNPATKQNEPLGIVASEEELTMAVSDCTAKAAPIDGRFPNVDAVLPKEPPTASIAISPKLLMGLLRTAMAFADPNNQVVVMHVWDGREPQMLGFSTRNETQTFDGLLVGVCEKKESGVQN